MVQLSLDKTLDLTSGMHCTVSSPSGPSIHHRIDGGRFCTMVMTILVVLALTAAAEWNSPLGFHFWGFSLSFCQWSRFSSGMQKSPPPTSSTMAPEITPSNCHLSLLLLSAEFLALKHESRIFRHSSNPVCGFSTMEQVRLCAVWPMEN